MVIVSAWKAETHVQHETQQDNFKFSHVAYNKCWKPGIWLVNIQEK